MKPITSWTREEFEALPHISWNKDVSEFDSLILLPTNEMHDSGYLCMDFVAAKHETGPIGRLSGGSDVLHINGIGGLGANWRSKFGTVPQTVHPIAWSIDLLPGSGLFQLFCGRKLKVGSNLSSFEILAI